MLTFFDAVALIRAHAGTVREFLGRGVSCCCSTWLSLVSKLSSVSQSCCWEATAACDISTPGSMPGDAANSRVAVLCWLLTCCASITPKSLCVLYCWNRVSVNLDMWHTKRSKPSTCPTLLTSSDQEPQGSNCTISAFCWYVSRSQDTGETESPTDSRTPCAKLNHTCQSILWCSGIYSY